MSFEDLEVWKRACRLSVELYRQTRNVRDFGFRDQLTRSGLSIPSNVAEGFERGGDREIAQFLKVAKGSSGELRTQIYIGMQVGYLDQQICTEWLDESKQIGRMLGALIKKHRRE